jgi:hypothetical protein
MNVSSICLYIFERKKVMTFESFLRRNERERERKTKPKKQRFHYAIMFKCTTHANIFQVHSLSTENAKNVRKI